MNYYRLKKFVNGMNLWLRSFSDEILWTKNSEEAYLGSEDEIIEINEKLGLYGKVEKC